MTLHPAISAFWLAQFPPTTDPRDWVQAIEDSCPKFSEIFAALATLPESGTYVSLFEEDEGWDAALAEWTEAEETKQSFQRDFWYGSISAAHHADGRRGLYIVMNGCSAQAPYCHLVIQEPRKSCV